MRVNSLSWDMGRKGEGSEEELTLSLSYYYKIGRFEIDSDDVAIAELRGHLNALNLLPDGTWVCISRPSKTGFRSPTISAPGRKLKADS